MSDSSDPISNLQAALEGRYAIERELGEGGMAMSCTVRPHDGASAPELQSGTMRSLPSLLLVLLLSSCGWVEREREVAAEAARASTLLQIERVLSEAVTVSDRFADSADRILSPLPVMTPAEEDALRRFQNGAHVASARTLACEWAAVRRGTRFLTWGVSSRSRTAPITGSSGEERRPPTSCPPCVLCSRCWASVSRSDSWLW